MPFTPFHLGPGLAIKSLIPRQFSLSMFALANVVMDIEPAYRMLRIQMPVHGWTHTLPGALLIAAGSVLFGRYLITQGWRCYARLSDEMDEPFHMTWLQAWLGALIGTVSHLLLDAVMHEDLHPFAPWSDTNPLLMTAWMLHLHLACILAGMLGMLILLGRAAFSQENLTTPHH